MKTILAFILLLSTAYAHPPDHRYYEWFRKQYSVKGQWCCNESDGHSLLETEWRIKGNTYEVLIEGVWFTINPEQMIRDPGNPTGMAAIWYMKTNGNVHIYCFAPGMLF